MEECIQKATHAPIEYINSLRKLQSKSITMKQTPLYPALPMALLASMLCLLGVSAYMIYYFITTDEDVCFKNAKYGIIILAIVYPIESGLVYVCLFGSIAIAKSYCWKIFVLFSFGVLVTGFGFGGLGFAFLCTISSVNTLLIDSSFLSSNTFIQIIIYSYLSFLGLYVLLIPTLTVSHKQRQKDPSPDSSCGDRFCCILYYFCQILFMATSLFMIAIKIIGPPLLVYVMVEISRAGYQSDTGSLGGFFALLVLSVFLPSFVFGVVYVIANYLCKESEKKVQEVTLTNDTQVKQLDSSRRGDSVFLGNQPRKSFQENQRFNDIRNEML